MALRWIHGRTSGRLACSCMKCLRSAAVFWRELDRRPGGDPRPRPGATDPVRSRHARRTTRIVGKAMRKDPEQRYQVMKDLLLDLQALCAELAASWELGRRRWAVREGLPVPRVALSAAAAIGVRARNYFRLAVDASRGSSARGRARLCRSAPHAAHLRSWPADGRDVLPDGRSIAYASDRVVTSTSGCRPWTEARRGN